jgi:hypothetical protein
VAGGSSVSFVSPDGSEELTVARAGSLGDGEAVSDATGALLTPPARASGGPPDAVDLSYGNADRTSWRRVVPAVKGVWTITLTVPRAAAGSGSAALFVSLADGFTTVPV